MDQFFAECLKDWEENQKREERWEKKHGPLGITARLYLMEKPNALARGRLTTQRAEKIEHVLAWSFTDYSEVEIQAVCDEITRLTRMADVDKRLERELGPGD